MSTIKRSLLEWLQWLESHHPIAIDMGLARVGEVADRLQLRDLGCPVITVGGTNGKGSTVATLVGIYKAAGKRVGSYTSPHLIHFNERICLQGQSVSDEALVAAFEAIAAAQGDVSLTYFEFTTLAAFYIFKQAHLDIVVLEVGLGGRLDAVNLIDADVAVVTSIGIDHVEYLGNTREVIAIEKAGIFRKGKAAICGDEAPPSTLIEAAHHVGVSLQRRGVDYHFSEQSTSWIWQNANKTLSHLPKPALALENVATALTALFASPLQVSEEAIRLGLENVSLPGRLQRVAASPDILLDVAHNPHGARFLMQHLSSSVPGQRTFAVFAMLADKDIAGVIECCLGRIDSWFVAGLPVPRAASSHTIVPLLREQGCHVAGRYESVAKALAAARQQASAVDRIIVFGSFHTVAMALQVVRV